MKLRLTLRIFGDAPRIKTLACFVKNKWPIKSYFQIVYHIQSIFTITFRSMADILISSDSEWDMLGDVPISIRHEEPAIVTREVFLTIPQWVIMKELRPGMFAKKAVIVL